ncbi:hypothetical protein PG996_003403 [Apiospora saccharicola]|uniref:Nephrocystin 3-like N-terminal domain-containing protein n=1 Tax=Apiospora saccharicola TaxID=335842 RepID=A0ABR1W185_9PEZI
MADPLSMGASIIAFIEITNRIVSTCKYCIETVKDAPRDFQMILGETTSLEAIIETLKASGAEPLGLAVTLEACHRCLSALEGLLPKPQRNDTSGSKRRNITFAELAWPLKESKARKLLAEVSQHKATLLLAISGDMAHDIKAIRASINNVEESLTDSERLQTLRWLERVNPSTLHNQAWQKHHAETTSWLLQCTEWNDWLSLRNSHERFLWCFGIPGCGKTVMASFAIEQLKQHCTGREGTAQAYYYCHYSHNQDESVSFLRWTISQTCRRAKRIPQQLKKLYDSGCEPNFVELNNILATVLSGFATFYIVVDAIDESSPRSDLVALLATIALDKRFGNVRLLVTSRQYSDIENVFSGISVPLSMSNKLVSDDIRQFIQNRLADSRHLQRWPNLTGLIEESLVSGAQGMFRWAECQIYAIERLRTESQIRESLLNLPRDLAETYIRIFQQIPEADRAFVRRALIWLGGHAGAPWHTQHGINGDVLASAASHDLQLSGVESDPNFYNIGYFGELCGCLITISNTVSEADIMLDWTDKAAAQDLTPDACNLSLITFAHYTVLEFLASPFILETDVSYFALTVTTILNEFSRSVLLQAVNADPKCPGVSWLHDREAYCLTLAPALIVNEDWEDTANLVLRYCDPRSPHYSRIPKVRRFLAGIVGGWSFYFIYDIPEYHLKDHPHTDIAGEASILLNILLIGYIDHSAATILQVFLAQSHDLRELLATQLTVTNDTLDGNVSVTGTVLAILFHHDQDGTSLKSMYWLVDFYGHCLDPTAILEEVVIGDFKHQLDYGRSLIDQLIKHGADLNGLGSFLTPLKASVYHGNLLVARLLLEGGADTNFSGNFPRELQGGTLPQWIAHSNATPLALLRRLTGEYMPQGQLPEIERLLLEYEAVM